MKTIKISDGLQKIIDYRGKTPPKSATGITLISAANIKSGTLDFSRREFISEEDYVNWTTRGFTKPGDVLFTTEAPTAEVAIYPEEGTYQISRRVIALRADEKVLHNLYLFYLLQSPPVKQRMISANRGSTVPRLLKTDITQFLIEVPDYSQQKETAKILFYLDRKIGNLRKQNETLEATAQTLFKHWFVNLEFPNADGNPYKSSGGAMKPSKLGNIPEGWRIGTLDEIAIFKNGKSPPERGEDFQYPIYGSNGVIGYSNVANNQKTVIIGRVGSYCGSLFYYLDQCWVTDNAMTGCLRSHDSHAHLYFFLASSKLNKLSGGSGQPLLNQTILSSIELALPNKNLIQVFEDITNPLFEKIFSNQRNTQNLAKIRDSLLPKIMSGKFRIKSPSFSPIIDDV